MDDTANSCVKGSYAFDRTKGAIVDMMSAPQGLEAPCSSRRGRALNAFEGLERRGLKPEIRSRMIPHPSKREVFKPYSDDPYSMDYVPRIHRKKGESGVFRIIECSSGSPAWPTGSTPHYVDEKTEVFTARAFSACLIKWGHELEKLGFLTPELLEWLKQAGVAYLRGSSVAAHSFKPGESASWGEILRLGVFTAPITGKIFCAENTMKELRREYDLLPAPDGPYLLADVHSAALRRQRPLQFSMNSADQDKAAVTQRPGLQTCWAGRAG